VLRPNSYGDSSFSLFIGCKKVRVSFEQEDLTVNRQLISLRKAKGARGLESAVLRPVRIVHTILKPGKASIFKYHSGFWLVVEIQLFVCG